MTKEMTDSIYKTATGEIEIESFYNSVLDNWPVDYESFLLPTRHGDTHIIACGNEESPCLVLLHGAASNATSWIGDIAEYSRYFRVYAIDIPGDPGKSAQNRLSYQALGYAEWLYDVFHGLKIERASLIGLSQGGWTALRFATCYPERIERLVLLTPAGIVPTKVSFLMKAIVYTLMGRAGAKRINRLVFGKQPIHSDALKFMDLIMTHFKARIEKEYIFTDAELKRLEMPVLLIGGANDVIRSPEAIACRLGNCVPALNSFIIPDMGHVLIHLTSRIIPFLRGSE